MKNLDEAYKDMQMEALVEANANGAQKKINDLMMKFSSGSTNIYASWDEEETNPTVKDLDDVMKTINNLKKLVK